MLGCLCGLKYKTICHTNLSECGTAWANNICQRHMGTQHRVHKKRVWQSNPSLLGFFLCRRGPDLVHMGDEYIFIFCFAFINVQLPVRHVLFNIQLPVRHLLFTHFIQHSATRKSHFIQSSVLFNIHLQVRHIIKLHWLIYAWCLLQGKPETLKWSPTRATASNKYCILPAIRDCTSLKNPLVYYYNSYLSILFKFKSILFSTITLLFTTNSSFSGA